MVGKDSSPNHVSTIAYDCFSFLHISYLVKANSDSNPVYIFKQVLQLTMELGWWRYQCHHFGVSRKHSTYLCVFFSGVAPVLGSCNSLMEIQGRARDERSRANAFAEGRAEWKYHSTSGNNRHKKEDPGGLWHCFGRWLIFRIWSGCLQWLFISPCDGAFFLKAFVDNLDLAPAGRCSSSAISIYTQWYFFYTKYVCGHNLV